MNVEIGTETVSVQFLSGNICFEFSVLCICCSVCPFQCTKGKKEKRSKHIRVAFIIDKFTYLKTIKYHILCRVSDPDPYPVPDPH
jgi:hypothetical protein